MLFFLEYIWVCGWDVVFLFLFSLKLSVTLGCFLFQALYLGQWFLFIFVPSFFSPPLSLRMLLQPHTPQLSHQLYHQNSVHCSKLGQESTNSISLFIHPFDSNPQRPLCSLNAFRGYSLCRVCVSFNHYWLPCVFCLCCLLYQLSRAECFLSCLLFLLVFLKYYLSHNGHLVFN